MKLVILNEHDEEKSLPFGYIFWNINGSYSQTKAKAE